MNFFSPRPFFPLSCCCPPYQGWIKQNVVFILCWRQCLRTGFRKSVCPLTRDSTTAGVWRGLGVLQLRDVGNEARTNWEVCADCRFSQARGVPSYNTLLFNHWPGGAFRGSCSKRSIIPNRLWSLVTSVSKGTHVSDSCFITLGLKDCVALSSTTRLPD